MTRPYVAPVGESLWVPTPPNFGTAIEPYCEQVRPMVLRSTDEVVPEPPVPFSAEPGMAQGDRVGALVVERLTTRRGR